MHSGRSASPGPVLLPPSPRGAWDRRGRQRKYRPSAGRIEEIYYKPGKFLNASLDKASDENERNYFKVKLINGEEIIIVQIAGLIARRIVCEVEQDQDLKQGERIGMIRFGSRVDIYFKNKKVLAKLGQNVVAGESLLASN